MKRLLHICESCGKIEIVTSEQGFNRGWDYPPKMGDFKLIGPRTCGNCPVTNTVWWAVVGEGKKIEELSQSQMEVIKRIMLEPESLYVDDVVER